MSLFDPLAGHSLAEIDHRWPQTTTDNHPVDHRMVGLTLWIIWNIKNLVRIMVFHLDSVLSRSKVRLGKVYMYVYLFPSKWFLKRRLMFSKILFRLHKCPHKTRKIQFVMLNSREIKAHLVSFRINDSWRSTIWASEIEVLYNGNPSLGLKWEKITELTNNLKGFKWPCKQ